MEFVALWLCLVTAIGKRGRTLDLFLAHARRTGNIKILGTSRSLYRVLASFFFTAYYFAVIDLALCRLDPSSFNGIDSSSDIARLASFLYFSVITITTLGYGDITPKTWLVRAAAGAEAVTGVLLITFLFGTIVSFHVAHLNDE